MRTIFSHQAILLVIILIVSACSDPAIEKGPNEKTWNTFPNKDASEYATPEIKQKPHPMAGTMLIGRDGNIFGAPDSKVSLPTFKSSKEGNDQEHAIVSFHTKAKFKGKERVKVTLRSTTNNGEKVTRETVGYFCREKTNIYSLSIQPCSDLIDLSFTIEPGANKENIESEVYIWNVSSWCAKQGGTNTVKTENKKAKLTDIAGDDLESEPPSKVVQ